MSGSLPLSRKDVVSVDALPDFNYDPKSGPDFRFEDWLLNAGAQYIAGTDEAGRGPLAGPVVAAAVVLPSDANIAELNDSKKLTIAKRNRIFDEIMRVALAVSISAKSANTIDKFDIRTASLDAMRQAVAALSIRPDALLIDGRDVPAGLPRSLAAKALIKGDGRSLSIAAASVVAKVGRDRMMERLGAEYPGYGLEAHMGYGSAHHRSHIEANGGIQNVHRFSFRPLRKEL